MAIEEKSLYGEMQVSAQTRNRIESWKAFGRQRTLFIPVDAYIMQQYALNFFISNRLQRYLITLAIRVGFGRKVAKGLGNEWYAIKDAMALARAVEAKIQALDADHLVFERLAYAIRQGSVGPYQKMSLIGIKENGTPTFYAKLAVGAAADSMVEAESACLQRLSAIPALNGMVPLKLSSGQTPAGRSFFTASVAPYLKTMAYFEVKHEQFLSVLGHATVQWVRYRDSLEFQFTTSALERLSIVLGSVTHAQLQSVLNEIKDEIGDLKLPTVLAHRDFSPWNIRWHSSGIFVFDWEYAAEGANPLYDFFHFHLIQRALSRWRADTLKPAYALSLISPALAHLLKTFPQINWTPKIVKYLLLAYLNDLLLFYADSGKKFDIDNPILSSYFNLILKRKQW